jgi:uroporphyrinogen-III decarboxylase
MRSSWSSRERMLAALERREPDYTPCSFMLFGALKSHCHNYAEFIERQIALGLDAFVELPPRPPAVEDPLQRVVNDHYNLHGLPVRYDPRVAIREWIVRLPDEEWPVMIKEYHTPAGVLRAEVRRTEDWRWGNHVPFLDDYIVPRSRKFLVTGPDDLPALRYLLVPPSAEEVAAFQAESLSALELARRHDLLVTGGWGVGADLIGWVHGLENMVFAAYDRPDFLAELLGVIAAWNRQRMEVVLGAGIDLYIKRAWYENCDFWSPKTWRKFIYPILKADVDLAHQAGAKFGYIITSNCMLLLDMIAEVGVDAVIGVDPHAWDLAVAKTTLGSKICLWGGLNGHLTVEQGSEAEVRSEVVQALTALAPGGGFILSPVDNIRENTERSRANVLALIDEWKARTRQTRYT